ncbi:unnamed protein product [Leptidea sinapis]|uniref:Uncharacterized protein n=1 Tax=Leptidea sinapis TaxID=189913 RepID=A0A5E4PNZ1_9NEOP|nr:unnamed protein product [Leptidea sinapis]
MHNKRKRNREPNIKPFPASIGGDQNYAMQDYNFHDNYNSGINSFGFGYDAYGSGHSRGHPSFYRQNSMIVDHRQYYPITTREKYRNFGKPSNNSSGFESRPESNIVSQFQQQKSSNLHTGSGNFGSTFNNTRGPESNTATQFQQQKSFNVNRGAGFWKIIMHHNFNSTNLIVSKVAPETLRMISRTQEIWKARKKRHQFNNQELIMSKLAKGLIIKTIENKKRNLILWDGLVVDWGDLGKVL